MTERAQALLKLSSLQEPLVAALERTDVVFALTDQTLLYQDLSGVRRVTLRDLTRIHSDQDGTLRVETPAGTALTASLVGFDPVDVQGFFAQVRDTTARVKQYAASGVASAPAPASTPTTPPSTPPSASSRPSTPLGSGLGTAGAAGRTSEPPAGFQESVTIIRTAGSASPVGGAPVATGNAVPTPVPTPTPAPSSGASAESRTPAPQATPAAAPTRTPPPPPRAEPKPSASQAAAPVAAAQPAAPVSVAKPAEPAPTPAKASPAQSKVADPAPSEDEAEGPTSASAARPAVSAVGTLAALAAHAEGVRAWVGRLRFMGALLLLAALALAYLQLSAGQGLQGVWVLIAGGISAVGLFALADLTKLLVSLATAVSAEGGVMDVD